MVDLAAQARWLATSWWRCARRGPRSQRLADHDLVDRLVDLLLEARHVDALLLRVEVAEAGQLGLEEPLVAVVADADRLGGARHAGAGEADGGGGLDSCRSSGRERRVVLIGTRSRRLRCARRDHDGGPRLRARPSSRYDLTRRSARPAPGRKAFMTTHPSRPQRSGDRPAGRRGDAAARHGRAGEGLPHLRRDRRACWRRRRSPRSRSRTSTRTCSRSASRCWTPTARSSPGAPPSRPSGRPSSTSRSSRASTRCASTCARSAGCRC